MKINTEIDSYDVKSLEALKGYTARIVDEISAMNEASDAMQKHIVAIAGEFTSINYDRISGVYDDLKAKLASAGEEMSDFKRSIDEFIEKLERIWS